VNIIMRMHCQSRSRSHRWPIRVGGTLALSGGLRPLPVPATGSGIITGIIMMMAANLNLILLLELEVPSPSQDEPRTTSDAKRPDHTDKDTPAPRRRGPGRVAKAKQQAAPKPASNNVMADDVSSLDSDSPEAVRRSTGPGV
jgi:hypothetical protein